MFQPKLMPFLTLLLLLAIHGGLCLGLATLDFTLGTQESPFECNVEGNLWCAGNASTSSGGILNLTPNKRNESHGFYHDTFGMALFSSPINMLDGKRRWMSFSTNFTFRIERSDKTYAGDGMAFVMLSKQRAGAPGGAFGVYGGDGWQVVQTLAIEFDTYGNSNYGDRNENHVGVDLETIRSKVSRDAYDVGIALAGGKAIHAWIDYHAVSEVLEVRISLINTKPKQAFLTYPLTLSDVFGESGTVHVGFSGSNGLCICHNFYSIYYWNFQVFPEDRSILFLVELIGGIFILTVIVVVVVLISGRFKKNLYIPILPEAFHHEDFSCRRFSYKELDVATSHFDERLKLGEGGFGSVYRGVLHRVGYGSGSGELVAVKKLKDNSTQGRKEFEAELSIISQLRHRHIVRLLGWCRERKELLLAYELMPKGGLDKALFSPGIDSVLSWKQRYTLIVDVTSALLYLHEGWRQQIIHRDIKTSNIMLDRDFRAMLGDFGLARLVKHDQSLDTTLAAGTFGYLAPEAIMSGKFTDKTDVYAFGTVLLEIVCARRALDKFPVSRETLLVNWVWSRLENGDLLSVVDSRLEGQFDLDEVDLVLRLGLLCSHPSPNERPAIKQIVGCLESRRLVGVPPVPSPRPTYKVSPFYNDEESEGLTTKRIATIPNYDKLSPLLMTQNSLPLSTYSS